MINQGENRAPSLAQESISQPAIAARPARRFDTATREFISGQVMRLADHFPELFGQSPHAQAMGKLMQELGESHPETAVRAAKMGLYMGLHQQQAPEHDAIEELFEYHPVTGQIAGVREENFPKLEAAIDAYFAQMYAKGDTIANDAQLLEYATPRAGAFCKAARQLGPVGRA